MALTAFQIARHLGIATPPRDATFPAVCHDTRALRPGDLFAAMKGENTDGHAFIADAVKKGASGVLHEEGQPVPKGVVSLAVKDALLAYRETALLWRRQFSYPVIAVGGSAGKTTSKELIAALLRGRWPAAVATEGNKNGLHGIPHTLVRLRPESGAAVVEIGIDEIGTMAQHARIVEPSIAILTSIGPEHLEKLVDVDTVEREEAKLFEQAERTGGTACVNCDDERIYRSGLRLSHARALFYSLGRIPSGHDGLEGKLLDDRLLVKFPSGGEEFPLPLEGRHNALNLLGALTAAHAAGLTPAEMRAGLATFTPPPGRSETHEWRGVKVFADFYNANPVSVGASLEAACRGGGARVWACLADMLELGRFEEELHRGLADPVLHHGVGHVLLFGPRTKHLEDELRRRGYQGELRHFDSKAGLTAHLRAGLRAGDVLMIKGSRSMAMDEVWEALQRG
ncbi:MAG: UDP-N-acetylmuramoyl-tripeptide--D-alanyl-D-alanine ligase [Bdellovibrionales bacterium]|nr:UDP-N-acetylmuramoyl-tripeptide--D-alanyl-D-alanine ligase [Bdellovibrionales bacterium]